MISEVTTLKLKFDPNTLPIVGPHLSLRLAIGKPRLHRFNKVAEFFCDHSKQEYDALLIDSNLILRKTMLSLREMPRKVLRCAECNAQPAW
jgi:hypothetical protein